MKKKLIALILILSTSPILGGEIVTFEKTINTAISSIKTEEGKLVLTHEGGKIDCKNVLSVVFAKNVTTRSATRYRIPGSASNGSGDAKILLATGDVLKGAPAGGDNDNLVVETPILGNVSILYEGLRAVFFPRNIESRYATYQAYVLDFDAGEDDVIFLKTGQTIKGWVENMKAGGLIIREKDTKAALTVEYSKVAAVRLFQDKAPRPPSGLWGRCHLADGCVVSGKISSYGVGVLKLKTGLAGLLSIKAKNVERFVFRGKHFTFLSDMKTISVKETAYIQAEGKAPAFFFHMKKDRTVVKGKPLSIRGRKYMKGLGMSAETHASYALDGKYDEFSAVIGLDDEGKKGLGLVDFIVKGDGAVLFKKEKVTMKDAAATVRLDVRGVKKLTLIVAFHQDPKEVSAEKRVDSGPAENWAAWGNALVRKK